jgi:hypothetical protein
MTTKTAKAVIEAIDAATMSAFRFGEHGERINTALANGHLTIDITRPTRPMAPSIGLVDEVLAEVADINVYAFGVRMSDDTSWLAQHVDGGWQYRFAIVD